MPCGLLPARCQAPRAAGDHLPRVRYVPWQHPGPRLLIHATGTGYHQHWLSMCGQCSSGGAAASRLLEPHGRPGWPMVSVLSIHSSSNRSGFTPAARPSRRCYVDGRSCPRAPFAAHSPLGPWDYCARPAGVTRSGCRCRNTWSLFPGDTVFPGGSCGNPDSDPQGPWCVVDESTCTGECPRRWGGHPSREAHFTKQLDQWVRALLFMPCRVQGRPPEGLGSAATRTTTAAPCRPLGPP